MTAVERAKELGTYEAEDRSKQYPLDDRAQVHDAINKCWTKVHALEAANRKKDETIAELKLDRASLKRWLKVLTFLVTIEGALLGWFATSLLDCMKATHLLSNLLK